MIAIIDYGLGNLGSISNMLKVIGERSTITDRTEEIVSADGIILPGVGAFDAGMSMLEMHDLIPVIKDQASLGKPILGICLGMQLLGNRSEEGSKSGLSLIPFECKRFRFKSSDQKIPHMGWDIVDFKCKHPILDNLSDKQRYYFVHSYHAVCNDPSNILMTCEYGYEFTAAVVNRNIIGVQFHPEKSLDYGLALFENFVKLCKEC